MQSNPNLVPSLLLLFAALALWTAATERWRRPDVIDQLASFVARSEIALAQLCRAEHRPQSRVD